MDGIVEVPQIPADAPEPIVEPEPSDKPKPWLFNRKMAKAAAIKSVAARELKELEATQAKAIVAQLKAAAIVEPDDQYRLFRLSRTRTQLLELDEQLSACRDPKLLKSLADAIARLCDVEQRLAMRPLPGSRRPGRESTSKAPSTFEPSE